MSETPHKKQDFLELAKHQLAQITTEFEKALDALKDPERRKQLTASYLDVLQKGLARAQDGLAKYQEKVASQERTAGAQTGSASAASPMAATPESEPEEPPS
jgi:hypothetical protein